VLSFWGRRETVGSHSDEHARCSDLRSALLLRHLPRVTGAYTAAVHVPGVGRFHMRAGKATLTWSGRSFCRTNTSCVKQFTPG